MFRYGRDFLFIGPDVLCEYAKKSITSAALSTFTTALTGICLDHRGRPDFVLLFKTRIYIFSAKIKLIYKNQYFKSKVTYMKPIE